MPAQTNLDKIKPPPESAPDPKPARASARRRLWLVVSVIAVLTIVAAIIAAFWYFRSTDPSAGAPGRGRPDASRPMPVVTAAATTGSIDVYLNALGTVMPRNIVTVRARVDGMLSKLAFREGQTVKEGQVLAEIDPRQFEVQLVQSQGQLARDQALLNNAKLDLQRYQTLLAQDSIAKQQVDAQQALVRQYEGAVQSDQGSVDNAKLQLSYTHVTAPIGGRVGLRQIDPGNLVHASDANGLVVIAQLQPITVLFTLPEDNIPRVMARLRDDRKLAVDVFDRDQTTQLASGTLLTVDNQIDTATGTVKLKAEFANRDGTLFPNQFVNVRMRVDTLRDAVVAPGAAIQRGSQGTFVYVVKDDGSVTVRPVKLGTTQAGNVSIESGLSAGELVVVDGGDKLREGAKVEPVTKESQTPPPAQTKRHGATSPDATPRGDRPRRADGQRRSDGSGGS